MVGHAGVGGLQIGRDACAHSGNAGHPEAREIERAAMDESADRTHRVQACEAPAHDPQVGIVVEFRRTAATPRVQRHAEAVHVMQAGAAQHQGRNDRQVAGREFGDEGVFLGDRGVTPALRPVELGHHRFTVVETDLVDAVLVAVQGQQTTVAAKTAGFDRIENEIGRQAGEGMRPCHRRRLVGFRHASRRVQRRHAASAATWSSTGKTSSRPAEGKPKMRWE